MYGLSSFEQIAILVVLGIAILGLLYAIFLRSQILREDKGTEKMQKVWNAIREGADAYLKRQLRSILPLIAILTVLLFASVYIVKPTPEAAQWYCMAFKGDNRAAAEVCARSLTPAERSTIEHIDWPRSSPGIRNGGKLLARSGPDRHAYGSSRKRSGCICSSPLLRRLSTHWLPGGNNHWHADRWTRAVRWNNDLYNFWDCLAGCAAGFWIRWHLAGFVHARWGWYLYQSCRCRGGPCR